MTTIICRAVETIAVCAVIAILGFKALGILDSYANVFTKPSHSIPANEKGGK
jgi:hypothetical protein